MSSAQNNNANNNGGRPTGATGGGHHRNTCRNYQQPGHPPQYMFVDLPGALCAHCQVSLFSSTIPQCANHQISVQTDHPAEADSISHAATQLQNFAVDLPTNLTVPDYFSSALEGTISALLYASQCGVLSLE
ncbi:hypothetical protein J1614_004701 [Plenodomus biglobosus]|nr:hypothetical protein J1614_004701 [Plenodomus biglobosus]